MLNRIHFHLSLWLTLGALCALGVQAQTHPEMRRAPLVTASVADAKMRFAALPHVYQLRLEVFAADGAKLFDSAFKSGNLFDWPLHDQQGQPLADGAYLCVVTVKDFAGRLTQQRGAVTLQAGQPSLAPDQAELTMRELSARLPGDRNEPLAVLPGGVGLAATLLVHDGQDGRLVNGSGDLSFRTGDIFAGKDVEQMRLTAEGNLGIGLKHPQARLDVGGLIRTSEGIMFPDGSVQTTAYVAAGVSRGASARLPQEAQGKASAVRLAPSIEGTGTTNRITKWIDGPNGVVGDSVISEVSGNVGVGTGSPAAGLDYRGSTAAFFTRDIGTTNFGTAQSALQLGVTNLGSRNAGVGPSFLFFADNSAGNKSFLGRVSGVWENPTAGAEAGAIFFQVRANSGDVSALTERMRITAAGNVGIGTTVPTAKLHVAGGDLLFENKWRAETTTVNFGSVPGPPNLIGGFLGTGSSGATPGNRVTAGVIGATIGGGGFNGPINLPSIFFGDGSNQVTDWFGTVGGGYGNRAGNGDQTPDDAKLATVGGGYHNTASGSYATVGGGQNNTASGNDASVGGGDGNTASGGYATVGGGFSNRASGSAATVGGGGFNTASGNYAVVPGGKHAVASHYGELAFAGDYFFVNGDAQASLYTLRSTTTDATATELFLDFAETQRITIAAGRALTFDILVTAKAASGVVAGYKFAGVIKNNSGTTILVGSVANLLTAEDASAAGWNVTVTADNTNDSLKITVTGAASTTIRWHAVVRTSELSF
jgi:hypothetical protein